MKVTQFIEDVLIKEIADIQQNHHYLSFLLISSGIEFLGACIDNQDFDEVNLSKKRFVDAIETFFPSSYKPHARNLYNNLRCGLAHIVSPNNKIGLTQLKESKLFGTTHLGIDATGNLILIAETFFDDFKIACDKVIELIQKGTLTHPKLTTQYLLIPGELSTTSSLTPPASGSGR